MYNSGALTASTHLRHDVKAKPASDLDLTIAAVLKLL